MIKMNIKLNDTINLENYNLLKGICGRPRTAKIVEIHNDYIICQSVGGGYREYLNGRVKHLNGKYSINI
jgi:hypothetical protein